MTEADFKKLKELKNNLIKRVETFVDKMNSEVNDNEFKRFSNGYKGEDVVIEISKNEIMIWNNNSVQECLSFCSNPLCKPYDIPIEVLWDDEALNKYIQEFKDYSYSQEEERNKLEYKEYLKLKEKYEKSN